VADVERELPPLLGGGVREVELAAAEQLVRLRLQGIGQDAHEGLVAHEMDGAVGVRQPVSPRALTARRAGGPHEALRIVQAFGALDRLGAEAGRAEVVT
jgi:hypothetical protein